MQGVGSWTLVKEYMPCGQINKSRNIYTFLRNTFRKRGLEKKFAYLKILLEAALIQYFPLELSHASVQFSLVSQLCPTLCDLMDHSMASLPVHCQLPEFTQTYVHWVSDAMQPSHPLLSPSPPAFTLSQHQGLFKMSQHFPSGGQSIGGPTLQETWIPFLQGQIPWRRDCKPLQYSCLENPVDRRA